MKDDNVLFDTTGQQGMTVMSLINAITRHVMDEGDVPLETTPPLRVRITGNGAVQIEAILETRVKFFHISTPHFCVCVLADDEEEAVIAAKKAIRAEYGRKYDEVVVDNIAVVESALIYGVLDCRKCESRSAIGEK